MGCARILGKCFSSTALTLAVVFSCSFAVQADDDEARKKMVEAQAEMNDEDYRSAADAYLGADLLADSPDIKLEALQKAAVAFDKADLQYKRFKCLKKIIAGFADRVDFAKIVETEYEIANKFQQGHRDVSLSWLPWVTGPDKSVEIYETILKQAPFAKFAPELRLKLGRMQLEKGENKKALATFRELIKRHPKSKEAKYARFELANALKQMAGRAGDGDLHYASEADAVLKEIHKLYPKDPETPWINESLTETEALKAKRLYEWGVFYQSRENPEAATRYFNDLLARYPSCAQCADAKKRLADLDPEFKVPPPPQKNKQTDPYPIKPMVYEKEVILVAPEASGGKWMLPIPDLDLNSKRADAEYRVVKAAEDEKRKKEKAKAEAAREARADKRKRNEKEEAAKKKAEDEKRAAKEKIAREKADKTAAKLDNVEAAVKKASSSGGQNGKKRIKNPDSSTQKPKPTSTEQNAKPKPTQTTKAAKPGAKPQYTPTEASTDANKAPKEKNAISSAILPLILILLLLAVAAVIWKKKRKER